MNALAAKRGALSLDSVVIPWLSRRSELQLLFLQFPSHAGWEDITEFLSHILLWVDECALPSSSPHVNRNSIHIMLPVSMLYKLPTMLLVFHIMMDFQWRSAGEVEIHDQRLKTHVSHDRISAIRRTIAQEMVNNQCIDDRASSSFRKPRYWSRS